MKVLVYLLLASTLVIFSCHATWEPSDSEAVYLVESYYLFAREGKEVDAEIISRKGYNGDCKCFPIKFKITVPEYGSHEKTFYFFKNEAGRVEVREYMKVIR